MHGTLRLILALVVTLSHLGVTLYGYNPGVVAVVIFYLLAGMVAYKLSVKKFNNQALIYYKDRFERIFPLYLFALLFSYIVYILGAESYFISKTPGYIELISNITILPLSYYMYTGIDQFTLLPPVWSLGVELQFYLMAPLLLRKKRYILFGIVISYFFYVLASIGYINTDYFGYRLIVGVLFMFLVGVLLQEAIEKNSYARQTLSFLYMSILLLYIYIQTIGYKAPYNHETILGLLIGIPLLYFFRKGFAKNIDIFFGQVSYAVFLLHFPILWIFKEFFKSELLIVSVVIVTILVSIVALKILSILKRLF